MTNKGDTSHGSRYEVQLRSALDPCGDGKSMNRRTPALLLPKTSYRNPALVAMGMAAVLYFIKSLKDAYGFVNVKVLMLLIQDHHGALLLHLSDMLGTLLGPWILTIVAGIVIKTDEGRRFRWGMLFTIYMLLILSALTGWV